MLYIYYTSLLPNNYPQTTIYYHLIPPNIEGSTFNEVIFKTLNFEISLLLADFTHIQTDREHFKD